MKFSGLHFGITFLIGTYCFAATGSPEVHNPPAAVPDFGTGVAVAVSRETQFDFTSKINGQPYRLMISAPAKAKPGESCAVIYVLDGNWYFRAMSDTVTWGSGNDIPPVIVVGIGYPTEKYPEVRRRRLIDLTISPNSPGTPPGEYGGADVFIRVLEEEIKPFVQSRFPVDTSRQILFGKSHGGQLALRVMFRHPEYFSTYIAGSPAIWWNNRELLNDESAFSKRVQAGGLHLKLLIASAGDEQYRGTDPALLAKDRGRLIDNASELAARLSALDPKSLAVTRVIFPDEGHNSVSLATIARAVYFALPPPKQP